MMGALLAIALLATGYQATLAQIEEERAALAAEYTAADSKSAVLVRARGALLRGISARIFPAWMGTPWEFNGSTRIPREGAIACGRFVATVLRDAGLHVDVRPLAQQLALIILRTFAPQREIRWSRTRTLAAFAAEAAALPDGLYGLGLDQHVGFLLVENGQAWFVHSSWVKPKIVVREPVASSRALELSRSHVFAPLLGERVVAAWLTGVELPIGGAPP